MKAKQEERWTLQKQAPPGKKHRFRLCHCDNVTKKLTGLFFFFFYFFFFSLIDEVDTRCEGRDGGDDGDADARWRKVRRITAGKCASIILTPSFVITENHMEHCEGGKKKKKHGLGKLTGDLACRWMDGLKWREVKRRRFGWREWGVPPPRRRWTAFKDKPKTKDCILLLTSQFSSSNKSCSSPYYVPLL